MVVTQASGGTTQQADPRRWQALAVVLIASFMILLDISIVNVAIPSVQRDLGATYADIQWVLAGYQLAYAVVLITGGRLGDIFGRKRLFIIGVAGFTLASLICGLAPSPLALIAARVFQGLMAALMYPQVLSVIQVSFPPRERGAAFGVFGGVVGVASISGPLLGGLLIQADIHLGGHALLWRPIFLVNLPIGIGAIIAAFVFLRESRAPSAPRLDIPGVVLASVGLFMIAFPLVEGRAAGWPFWAYVMLAGGLLVLVAFRRYIRARAASGGSPLVEPQLFSDRAFVVGSAIAMVFFAGIPAFFLTFSLYVQIGLGFSALHAGLTTLPFALCSAAASGVSIRLAPRLGKRILSVGCVLLILGMVGLWITLGIAGTGVTGFAMIPALAVCGTGLGFVVAPLINIILAGIHAGSAGSASGVLTTVQQVGGALGVAVIGIIFFGQVSGYAPVVAQSSAQTLAARLSDSGVPPQLAASATRTFTRCFVAQAASSDPSATPAGCPAQPTTLLCPPGPAQVFSFGGAIQCAVAPVATQAVAEDFDHAFRDSLFFEMAAFGLVFVMVFALPRPKNLYGPPGGGGEH
jgi:EmrB/QacA subfamily drug resistance transporter